jgi:uncharacterized pyridoxal phosphate-containing UPF0001 family protein
VTASAPAPSELRRRASELEPLVASRLGAVRERIERAGGDPGAVRVVAVTKTHGPEAVLAALAAGIVDIAENYPGELLAKAAEVSAVAEAAPGRLPSPVWHLIGAIQRNKIGRLAPVVTWWQSLWRPEEVSSLARHGESSRAKVLVEVNLAGDPARPGCALSEVAGVVARACEAGLDVRGLMAVAPLGPPGSAGPGFRAVAAEAARLGLPELSLGMSGDLEEAVRAGTTMVRIGTALFGSRDPRAPR